MARITEVLDKEVITADAFDVGEVSGAEVETKSWRISHLYVNLTDDATRELGFKKPFLGRLTVCLPVNVVKAYGDVITLSSNLGQLKELPECRKK